LRILGDEQASLRRLANAVARGVSPDEIFTAVAEEIPPLLGADEAAIARFDPGRTFTLVAGAGAWVNELGVGTHFDIDDARAIATVFRTGRSARVDHDPFAAGSGPLMDYLRQAGGRSTVASPIVVEGRAWGAMVASGVRRSLPPNTEGRMANVTELVAMVIANAAQRAELSASRARLVAAADDARRRIERDLHDGAQQRLVTTVMALKVARQKLGDADGELVGLVDEALGHAEAANAELRELAHGILPAALSRGGLRGGIDTLVSRVRLPVSIEVTDQRLPAALEATAYFIVSEALTNAVRHARARSARVVARVEGGALRLEVRDDGVGGARAEGSSGLLGLRDRAAAMDGELHVDSPPGRGTVVTAVLPVAA
jgi:signal transduction histidine kinase